MSDARAGPGVASARRARSVSEIPPSRSSRAARVCSESRWIKRKAASWVTGDKERVGASHVSEE